MPRSKQQESRDEFVTFRAGPAFKAQLREHAAAEDRTVSGFVARHMAAVLKTGTKVAPKKGNRNVV